MLARRVRVFAAAATLLAAVAGAGCASHAGRPATPASLQIGSPGPNAVTGASVIVDLRLLHAHIVPGTQIGGAIRPDQGHIHLFVDGQLTAMPYSLRAVVPGLGPGQHTIEAEFVAADHLPFANRVVAAVTIRAR